MTEAVDPLIAACQEQQREAQRQLYDRYCGRLFRLAVRIVGHNDAADVTQQIFLHLFQTIDQFGGRSRFETWLYRLAINECYQHLRRAKRHPEHALAADPAGRATSHTTRVEQRELLETALERLEPDLRAIFVLREVEELNYAQIAETLGIPDGTVASRLNRARSQLRDILVELGWEP